MYVNILIFFKENLSRPGIILIGGDNLKNIILLGVPRAGKSTFAKMLVKEFPSYNILQDDAIIGAYLSASEDLQSERQQDKEYTSITLDMQLAREISKRTFECSIKYEPTLNYLLDTKSLSVEDAHQYKQKGNIVIVFGYPNITAEECFHNIVKYDTEEDWTYIEPGWRLMRYCKAYTEDSKKFEKDAKKFHLKFVDTSYNREAVLNELLEWVKKQLTVKSIRKS